jgi:signal transduction histidine kinase
METTAAKSAHRVEVERTEIGRPSVVIGRWIVPQWAIDVGVAIALALLGVFEILGYLGEPGANTNWGQFVIGLSLAFVLISTLSLAFRRLVPMVVLVLTASAVILSPMVDESASGWIALMIGCFSAGMQGPRRRNIVLGFVALGAIDLIWWTTLFGTNAFDPVLPGLVAVAAGFMWAGSALRVRTRQAADLRADTVRLQVEREHAAERAASAERSRIARELHDVIAHSLSVVVIQAAAARRMLDTDPERARESLNAVEQTGRSAMLEMRRLLGVVRRDEQEVYLATEAPRVPQPSVSELPRVVADMRQAGLDVTLRVEGESRELPVGVDVSAYRIVQEALTNVTRHSVGARAEVVIRYKPHELEIGVEDDGGGGLRAHHAADPDLSADREQSSGHGLVGMRERVALLRGELEVGPRAQSGFEVHARLPLDEAPA